MFVIVGLGNIGKTYENTRHNSGFMAVDLLAQKLGLEFKNHPRLMGMIAKNQNVILVKPTTFMNLSGECVKKVIAYFDKSLIGKKELRTLYILHDDLDLGLGQSKLVFRSGPKGHNGVNSVREALGTDQFWYGRFGVDDRTPQMQVPSHDYVLSQLPREARESLRVSIASVIDKLYVLVTA